MTTFSEGPGLNPARRLWRKPSRWCRSARSSPDSSKRQSALAPPAPSFCPSQVCCVWLHLGGSLGKKPFRKGGNWVVVNAAGRQESCWEPTAQVKKPRPASSPAFSPTCPGAPPLHPSHGCCPPPGPEGRCPQLLIPSHTPLRWLGSRPQSITLLEGWHLFPKPRQLAGLLKGNPETPAPSGANPWGPELLEWISQVVRDRTAPPLTQGRKVESH